jgi:hypothetical protein
MGAPVQWGDVGTWLGTGAGIAALFRGLGNRQQAQFLGWAEMLEELTDLEPEELRRTVEGNPVIAEIVGIAAEEAARTASDNKRYLLAQVVAAAMRGDSTTGQVDALLYLARTVAELDPADLTLLIIIGTTAEGQPRPIEPLEKGDGEIKDYRVTVPREELAARWPAASELLDPALASLERAGVTERRNPTFYGGDVGWALNGYGELFLGHLLTDLGGWPPTRQL